MTPLECNSLNVQPCKHLINNYMSYFSIIKKNFLSENAPIMITSITIKLKLASFTDNASIIKVLDDLNVSYCKDNITVTLINHNSTDNPLIIYKSFCHEFIVAYISNYLNDYSSSNSLTKLTDHACNRITKFSFSNYYKDFLFYLNTTNFSNFFQSLAVKNISQ